MGVQYAIKSGDVIGATIVGDTMIDLGAWSGARFLDPLADYWLRRRDSGVAHTCRAIARNDHSLLDAVGDDHRVTTITTRGHSRSSVHSLAFAPAAHGKNGLARVVAAPRNKTNGECRMHSAQHIRVASVAWSIAVVGYLAACSDASSPPALPPIVGPTKATQLAVTTQPSASAQSGVAFATQPVVQLRDSTGAAVAQSGIAVIASIATGGGTLGGTSIATSDANGAATFSNLSIGGTVGARALKFTSGLLTPTVSNEFNITPGPVATLFISTIAEQTASAPFNVAVTLTDAYGNAAPNGGASGVITLSRKSGTGSLGGTTSAAVPVGATAVTVIGVTYSQAESGVTVLATGSGSGSGVAGQSGMSNSFTVTAPTGDTSGVRTYTTNFAAVESPISEGGRWVNGGTNGLDWSDVWSTGGKGIGRQTGASYTDATALLTGTWSANQQGTATVFTSGTVSEECYPEVELRLRSTISAHVNRGYEISFKVSQSGSAYLIIVRWNGPLGDFTYLLKSIGAQYGVKNGDIISAKVVGNVITAYKNGVVMGSASDNTYADGAPGMGFNLATAPMGCAGSNDKYGYTQFSATDGVR
jgi:hypothetical protein